MLTGWVGWFGSWVVVLTGFTALSLWLLGLCHIPRGHVGVVERMWSPRGTVQPGRLIALEGEAGFMPDVLREGWHLFFYPFQYRVRKMPQVVVCPGFVGCVFARDGQRYAGAAGTNGVDFLDVRNFLEQGGRRGRQTQVLGEGVYAINLAQFVVTITRVQDTQTDGHGQGQGQGTKVEQDVSSGRGLPSRMMEVALATLSVPTSSITRLPDPARSALSGLKIDRGGWFHSQ